MKSNSNQQPKQQFPGNADFGKLKYYAGSGFANKKYFTGAQNGSVMLPGVKIAKAYMPKDPK